VYFDPSYNTPDVLIGYYPNPYEEYYFKFDMYINSLKKNLELYNSFFVADFSLDEKNEKSLKEILRKENTKNENYYKIINEECDLMINELIRRKGVFEEVTECIEKDLLEDPNFLYTSNQKYSKENGYDIDRPLFEKAEKMVNSIASSISSPIFRIIKKKNDYANKLK
jgi:cytochrome oxidase Cu insertion factor (SCO1/SenC/PrrC family)